jgi:hypothetical protein
MGVIVIRRGEGILPLFWLQFIEYVKGTDLNLRRTALVHEAFPLKLGDIFGSELHELPSKAGWLFNQITDLYLARLNWSRLPKNDLMLRRAIQSGDENETNCVR